MKVHYRAVQPSGEAPRHRPTRWMVPARPCRRESPANRYGIELNHANGVARELGRAPIARLCTPDDYSDHCRESTVRVCAEVDTWASFDRSGPLRAGSYRAPMVCNAATIGSSHKRRWSDRRHQLAYRGAASGLPMACKARHSGRSESEMASLGPVLSATIPGQPLMAVWPLAGRV